MRRAHLALRGGGINRLLTGYSDFKEVKHGVSRGFTLAEVLIVLVVIGVVAVMVLPGLIQDISERVNSNKQANLAQKITKSVELMAVAGDYSGIKTTEEFVDKLQKHLKIIKICDNEHLEECWPTKVIETAKGETYEIKNAKTSKDLHTKGNSNTVGLVLADGSSLLMTFNPDAPPISGDGGFAGVKKALPIGKGKTSEFAYTSNATSAIDFVMDVNGEAGPNKENDIEGNYYDIRSFRTATFTATACAGGTVYEKRCIVDLGTDYDSLDCSNSDNADYCVGSSNPFDFWAGANKTCDDIGLRLPTQAEGISLYKSGKFRKDDVSFPLFYVSDKTVDVRYYIIRDEANNRSVQAPVFCISK